MRYLLLVLASLSLAGCILVPARPYEHPYPYPHAGYYPYAPHYYRY